MWNSNIPEGKVLDKSDRQQLEVELSLLKEWLEKLNRTDVMTDEYTPWQRVEHRTNIAAASHDIDAIEMSLETGKRIYG